MLYKQYQIMESLRIAIITALSIGLIFSVVAIGSTAHAQQGNTTSTTGQITKGEIVKGELKGGNITKGTVQNETVTGADIKAANITGAEMTGVDLSQVQNTSSQS